MEEWPHIHAGEFADMALHSGSGLLYLYHEHRDDVVVGGLHDRVTARPSIAGNGAEVFRISASLGIAVAISAR